MRFVIYPETETRQLPANANALHLARPIAAKKLALFLEKRQIESVSCSESTAKRLKPKHKLVLEQHGLSIEIEKRAGKPIQTDLKKMQLVLEMVHDHRSLREIEKTTGVPKSTVHYLVKYADRGKVKSNGKTVYLR
jgi:hypothetical protein